MVYIIQYKSNGATKVAKGEFKTRLDAQKIINRFKKYEKKEFGKIMPITKSMKIVRI